MRVDVAKRFTKDCHELGIVIHGHLHPGPAGETKETIEETIRFGHRGESAHDPNLAGCPYPGTVLYKQALANGWLMMKRRNC